MTLLIEQKMPKFSVSTKSRRHLLVLLALSGVFAAQAQPSGNSPNQFGDRQAGQWGDPGKGYFGNPAAGQFDNAQVKVPPPGTKPLGRVYSGKAPEGSPYLSLPAPADAAPAATPTPAPVAKAASSKKISKQKKPGKPKAAE